jgi:hypothetical protein
MTRAFKCDKGIFPKEDSPLAALTCRTNKASDEPKFKTANSGHKPKKVLKSTLADARST